MKNLLTILLFLTIVQHATALPTTWYFSNSGNDATGTGSLSSPYQTISKANSIAYGAGDILAFNGGNVFYGSLVINQNNVNIVSYGTGKATITGLVTVAGWSFVSGGIWQKSVVLKNALNVVTMTGVALEPGRYPNSDAANAGYIFPSAYSGNTTFTATELNGTNWTGAEVVARKQAYKFERDRITAQSGSTITYSQTIQTINPRNSGTPSPITPFVSGFGIFLQRDIRTLDKFGEWFYDSTGHVLSMYFGAANPASYTIQASNVDTLLNITGYTGTTISNIVFTGGNMAGVYWNNATGTSVLNCDFQNNLKAIFGWYGSNITVSFCTGNYSLCSGIDVRESTQQNVIINNNIFTNTAIIKGLIDNLDPADGNGIYVQSNGARLAFNQLDSIGQNGIHFDGNNIAVDSNLVNHYCYNLNDAGGIYTFPSNLSMRSNRQIVGNTIINGINSIIGTGEDAGSNPIYLDGGSSDVFVARNNIANSPGNGIGLFLNGPKNVTVRDNTVYNAWGWYIGRQYSDSSFNVLLKNNILFSIVGTQKVVQYTHDGLNSINRYTATGIQNAMQQMGTIDSNYYNVQDASSFKWYYANTNGGGFTFPTPQDLAYWQSYTNLDAHSQKSIYTTGNFQYNYSASPLTISFAGLSKKDCAGTVYNNSATIPAWGSKILIDNGTAIILPNPRTVRIRRY